MKKISHRQELFPSHRISLTSARNISDPQDMQVKLAEVLKAQLKIRNESVHSLAEATGIPSSTLAAWGAGQLPSAKNLHYVQKLSKHLGIPLSVLLFNEKENDAGTTILFQTAFTDNDRTYKLVIEKVKK